MANGVYINGSQLGAIHAVAKGITEYEFSPSNLRGSLANHREEYGTASILLGISVLVL